jgi:hypothetical protein
MEIYKEISNVKTKEDFIKFLGMLALDYKNNTEQWESKGVESYLESIKSWVEDMEGYYKNKKLDVPTNIDWNFFANVFYVGKIYE